MDLRKKLGVLLIVLSLILLFSGINSGYSVTSNAFSDYFQTQYIWEHIIGLILLIAGMGLIIERKGLDYLIIPAGDNLKELKRAKRAAKEKAEYYILSGGDKKENKLIYDELRRAQVVPSHMIIENTSKDTLENLMYSLKKMKNPKTIGIVSYPEHLRRFEKIVEIAKEEGKFPEDVKVKYIPTEQSFRETIYGITANVIERFRLRKGLDYAMKNKTKGPLKIGKK